MPLTPEKRQAPDALFKARACTGCDQKMDRYAFLMVQ